MHVESSERQPSHPLMIYEVSACNSPLVCSHVTMHAISITSTECCVPLRSSANRPAAFDRSIKPTPSARRSVIRPRNADSESIWVQYLISFDGRECLCPQVCDRYNEEIEVQSVTGRRFRRTTTNASTFDWLLLYRLRFSLSLLCRPRAPLLMPGLANYSSQPGGCGPRVSVGRHRQLSSAARSVQCRPQCLPQGGPQPLSASPPYLETSLTADWCIHTTTVTLIVPAVAGRRLLCLPRSHARIPCLSLIFWILRPPHIACVFPTLHHVHSTPTFSITTRLFAFTDIHQLPSPIWPRCPPAAPSNVEPQPVAYPSPPPARLCPASPLSLPCSLFSPTAPSRNLGSAIHIGSTPAHLEPLATT